MIGAGWLMFGLAMLAPLAAAPAERRPDISILWNLPLTIVFPLMWWPNSTGKDTDGYASGRPLPQRLQAGLWLMGVLGVVLGTSFFRWYPPVIGGFVTLGFVLITTRYSLSLSRFWLDREPLGWAGSPADGAVERERSAAASARAPGAGRRPAPPWA